MVEDILLESIDALATRIARSAISPVELTQMTLARIEQLDARFNAFITITADAALEAARDAEAEIAAGRYRGPLHGIPLALKDLLATRDVLTTAGSRALADWRPDYDATAVVRLRRAGAIVVGKTNMHELAYGSTSDNPHFGTVRNPWNPSHHPGGSSGGSAVAVAVGMAGAALGSDTGCSIRQPAHCCGIVGLKPQFGRVSKFGAVPLSWTMDHIGPLTRTVRDAAIVLQALAGHDPLDPYSLNVAAPDFLDTIENGVKGLRIGVARDFFFDDCDPEIAAAIERSAEVFRGLGAEVGDILLPEMDQAHAASNFIISSEASAYHAEALREQPEGFSETLRAKIAACLDNRAIEYLLHDQTRHRLRRKVGDCLTDWDGVLTPTSTLPATPFEDLGSATARYRNCQVFDLLGVPAISVPCGFTSAGLPVGLQIIGRACDEAMVLRIARAHESATEWHLDRPPC